MGKEKGRLNNLFSAHRPGQQFVLDAVQRGVDLFHADGAFAQGQQHAGAQFGGVEVDAGAVFLDHRWQRDFAAFVGGETLLALHAVPAASDDIAFVRFARLDDLLFVVGAKGAAHAPLLNQR